MQENKGRQCHPSASKQTSNRISFFSKKKLLCKILFCILFCAPSLSWGVMIFFRFSNNNRVVGASPQRSTRRAAANTKKEKKKGEKAYVFAVVHGRNAAFWPTTFFYLSISISPRKVGRAGKKKEGQQKRARVG